MKLIIGGTGTIGTHLLHGLRGRPDVRVLTHSPRSRAAATEHQLEAVDGDLGTSGSLDAAFADVERLFLLTPYTPDQLAWESNALDAAEAAGVEHVVKVSAFISAADPTLPNAGAHHRIEERLAASAVGATILRPDFFATNLLPGLAAGAIAYPTKGRVTVIDPRDIADAARVLLDADAPPTETITLTGTELLGFDEIADRLSKVLGRPIGHAEPPPHAWAEQAVAAGVPRFYADALVPMFAAFERHQAEPDGAWAERLLGRQPRSLEDWAADEPALR